MKLQSLFRVPRKRLVPVVILPTIANSIVSMAILSQVASDTTFYLGCASSITFSALFIYVMVKRAS